MVEELIHIFRSKHNDYMYHHKEWVEAGDIFKDKYNCYIVGNTIIWV